MFLLLFLIVFKSCFLLHYVLMLLLVLTSLFPSPLEATCYRDPVIHGFRSEIQRHGGWRGGLEGSDLDEAGDLQSLAGRPARRREPEAGKLPSRCRISKGEHAGRDFSVMQPATPDRVSLTCNPDTSATITSIVSRVRRQTTTAERIYDVWYSLFMAK